MKHWRAWASCAEVDPEMWYPEIGDMGGGNRWTPRNAAKTICHDCAVRVECLADCLRAGITEGTWGGIPAGTRRGIQRTFNQQLPDDVETFAERAIIVHDQLDVGEPCVA
jgi:hypothetical protein